MWVLVVVAFGAIPVVCALIGLGGLAGGPRSARPLSHAAQPPQGPHRQRREAG